MNQGTARQAPVPGQTHGRDSEERTQSSCGRSGYSSSVHLPGDGGEQGTEWGTGCMVTSAPFDITRFLDERFWHQEGTHGVSAVTVNAQGEMLVRIGGAAAGR